MQNKYTITKTNNKPIDPDAKYFILRYDHKSKDFYAVQSALLEYIHCKRFLSPESESFLNELNLKLFDEAQLVKGISSCQPLQ